VSIPDINSLRDDLLIELAPRRATNGSPQNVVLVCQSLRPDIDWVENRDLARSAGWLLVRNEPPLAKTVLDSEKPGAMLLALTAQGKSRASEMFEASKPKTLIQKVAEVPRSDWISILALIVSAIALLKGE
jgi:hypothetical protein